jgi:hypothetical protein
MRFPHSLVLLAALLGGLGGCSDSTSPGGGDSTPDQNFKLIRLAPNSPPILDPVQSFYAVRGEDRELRISFQDQSGGEGEEFLRLRVRPNSLRALPDGTPIPVGDSVLITVRIVNPANILFEMEPSGLAFAPDEPAELKIHYNHADPDLNQDGSVNVFDSEIKTRLAIWRQESSSQPFVKLGSVNVEDQEEINADILGFSRYAISY